MPDYITQENGDLLLLEDLAGSLLLEGATLATATPTATAHVTATTGAS